MDLVENDVDILRGEIKYLLGHLVENDVDTLHEERIYLVEFSFIRIIDFLVQKLYIGSLNFSVANMVLGFGSFGSQRQSTRHQMLARSSMHGN
jgi:hypothetical protein